MSPDAVHFETVFRTTYADLTRFASRRVDVSVAEDVAAEAFTVAWRRRADLPDDLGEARAWLFGITRNLILARHRHVGRDKALTVRLERYERSESAVPGPDATRRRTVQVDFSRALAGGRRCPSKLVRHS